MYLGVDFWKSFDVASEVLAIEEISACAEFEKPPKKTEPESHELNAEQRQQLDEVRKSFLSFEEHGLGRTEKMKHAIELVPGATPVKDRHYPVSPAVQQLIYQEINAMLRLGVIEESDSPWSNTITLDSTSCTSASRSWSFVIGGGVLKTDPNKVDAIKNMPIPRSAKEVRRFVTFLGKAGWYRRFVQNFAAMASPLTDTLEKGKKLEMTKESKEAMRRLQEALMTAPVLGHPDFGRKFLFQCDASDYEVGAVLFQEEDDEG
ncbi:hypothetical protein KR084_005244, partial [Drosophila pseudotakahashii]